MFGVFRFSIPDLNRRIDAEGSLVWADEASKVACVRFTTVTSEARGQVDTWFFRLPPLL